MNKHAEQSSALEDAVAMPARVLPVDDALPRIWSGQCRRDQDLTAEELRRLVALAADVKGAPGRYGKALDGK